MSGYVATIYTPGYMPMDDDPPVFDTAREAWNWLCDERIKSEEDATCSGCEEGPECGWDFCANLTETVSELIVKSCEDRVGSVYGDTPGYHGDYDLGVAYSVNTVD